MDTPAGTPPTGNSSTPAQPAASTPSAPATPSASATPSPTPPAASPSSPQHPPSGHKGMSAFFIIFLLIFSFVGGLFLSWWYFQSQAKKLNAQTADQKTQAAPAIAAKTPEKIIIGTDATAPPMEYTTKEGGLVGYDIDLGYRLGSELGVQVEFKNIVWDNIFDDLVNKKIDMIMSSVTITDERKQKYLFSDPYINNGQVIISRKDNLITSTDQLKGKKLSVQADTTNEKEALKLTSPELVSSFKGQEGAVKALVEGKVDAMIIDLALAKGAISQYDNVKISSDPFTNEYYGIVIHKDNVDLQKRVNDALSVLKVKGILTDLKQKWLE